MTHNFEQIAAELADAVFDRIEKDKTLIKQSIADVLLKELVFRFGRQKEDPQPSPFVGIDPAKPGSDVTVTTPGRTAMYEKVRDMLRRQQEAEREAEAKDRIREHVKRYRYKMRNDWRDDWWNA
jgi:hypothetical protein